MNTLEEGTIVLCTVTKIIGTIVFVKLEEHNLEGTITFSEISPGRIRNIRDYVNVGRKIVCKVLRSKPESVHLSLRRVKLKEKKEFNEILKKEKNYNALLKTILGEKVKQAISKIKEKDSLTEFLEKAKENSKELEKIIGKPASEKILKILKEKKQKQTTIKTKFSLTNKQPEGIKIIKKIIKQSINECKDCKINYIAAGTYEIKIKTLNPKQADTSLKKILENVEKLAKQKNCKFLEKPKSK